MEGEPSNQKKEQKQNGKNKKKGTAEMNGKPQDISKNHLEQNGQGKENEQPKSKAELRRERRELQEKQRAAKAGKAVNKPKEETKKAGPIKKEVKEPVRIPDKMRHDDDRARKRQEKNLTKQGLPKRTHVQKTIALFSHLSQYERETSVTLGIDLKQIHPAVVTLGLRYYEKEIMGSNARCVALMRALQQMIEDYETPNDKDLSRDLENRLKPNVSYLNRCRPMSVSMGHAVKSLKRQINSIPSDMNEKEAKMKLVEFIRDYVRENIVLAGLTISDYAAGTIEEGDVIMVYACSSVIQRVLINAKKDGKSFRVVVVDSRPRREGVELLKRLNEQGLTDCSYVLINAMPFVMPEVTKVFLGAYALLANGYVMSRAGSSQIAMVAKAFNAPVLVCCETYKFCERVQTDSIVFNELMDPDELLSPTEILKDWREHQGLALLNTMYDVTPAELVAMVVTEIGMLPCSSVPVVLRVKQVSTEPV